MPIFSTQLDVSGLPLDRFCGLTTNQDSIILTFGADGRRILHINEGGIYRYPLNGSFAVPWLRLDRENKVILTYRPLAFGTPEARSWRASTPAPWNSELSGNEILIHVQSHHHWCALTFNTETRQFYRNRYICGSGTESFFPFRLNRYGAIAIQN